MLFLQLYCYSFINFYIVFIYNVSYVLLKAVLTVLFLHIFVNILFYF